jgi:dolichyl-phosphate beta-glucosyltransferase
MSGVSTPSSAILQRLAPATADRSRESAALILSVVVPAFNESGRLPPYLRSMQTYFSTWMVALYEVIVIDDGSSDRLCDLLAAAQADWPQLKWIRHARNEGKGAAVRTGVLAATGAHILFADADGATPIEEEWRLREAIDAGSDVAIGSRLVPGAGIQRQRTWTRAALGRAFALLARTLFRLRVRDTQCGFKMFRRDCARRLFSLSQETGYVFDIEVLALAEHFGYRVAEVPVHWSEKSGSRMNLARDARAILSGLQRVRHRLRRMPPHHPDSPST